MLPKWRKHKLFWSARGLRNCINILFGLLIGCGLAGFVLQVLEPLNGDLALPYDVKPDLTAQDAPQVAPPHSAQQAAPRVSFSHKGSSAPSNRVEELILNTACVTNIFLAWTTPADTFTLRYLRTVESALLHHPRACVVVYSPTLPLDRFQALWDLGYHVIVERPDVASLLEGTPAEEWYMRVDDYKDGPYFFSHITEIIRLATLYKYGGIYLDTDVVVMKPLDGFKNALGTELAGQGGEAQVLNGAVLVFEKGSKFLWECMAIHNATYRIKSWGWNGPELVTRTARLFPQASDLHILPTDAFYPIHWRNIQKYFTDDDQQEQRRSWQRISRLTYLFHYWNKLTKDLVPAPGSLMFKVLNNYCILSCGQVELNNTAYMPSKF